MCGDGGGGGGGAGHFTVLDVWCVVVVQQHWKSHAEKTSENNMYKEIYSRENAFHARLLYLGRVRTTENRASHVNIYILIN